MNVGDVEKPHAHYQRRWAGLGGDYSEPRRARWILPRKRAKRKSPFQQKVREMLRECCALNPNIEVDQEILGGAPRIGNSRVSVDFVLDRLSVHGSVKSVIKRSLPQLNQDQVRDAIAFVRDFLEIACAELEANDR